MKARTSDSVAAECLLAAFARSDYRDNPRAYTGALIVLDALRELTRLRKALTTPPKE